MLSLDHAPILPDHAHAHKCDCPEHQSCSLHTWGHSAQGPPALEQVSAFLPAAGSESPATDIPACMPTRVGGAQECTSHAGACKPA